MISTRTNEISKALIKTFFIFSEHFCCIYSRTCFYHLLYLYSICFVLLSWVVLSCFALVLLFLNVWILWIARISSRLVILQKLSDFRE